MRLDKFLKLARLVKRRTVAQEMIELGAVRLEGRECKPSSEVREGNVIEIAYINRVMYLPEYAKEMRLTGIFSLMKPQ